MRGAFLLPTLQGIVVNPLQAAYRVIRNTIEVKVSGSHASPIPYECSLSVYFSHADAGGRGDRLGTPGTGLFRVMPSAALHEYLVRVLCPDLVVAASACKTIPAQYYLYRRGDGPNPVPGLCFKFHPAGRLADPPQAVPPGGASRDHPAPGLDQQVPPACLRADSSPGPGWLRLAADGARPLVYDEHILFLPGHCCRPVTAGEWHVAFQSVDEKPVSPCPDRRADPGAGEHVLRNLWQCRPCRPGASLLRDGGHPLYLFRGA